MHTVSSFIIDADARYACGSDHALLEVDISFGQRKSLHWSVQEAIQYNFSAKTNFKKFRECLDMVSSSVSSDDFASLSTEAMLSHLVSSLKKSGIDTFGLKMKGKYTRYEHRQTPTIFYLKLWTFALLFFSLDMEFLGLLVCLWTFKWVGGPLVGDFGCAVFIVESTNPKNLD